MDREKQLRVRDNLQRLREQLGTRHHLRPSARVAGIDKIAAIAVGLHAARLSSPFVAAWSRSSGIDTQALRVAFFGGGSLIKLRCMRRTLHIVPIEIAPIVHMATLAFRVSAPFKALVALGIGDRRREALEAAVEEALLNGPLHYADLLNALSSDSSCRRISSAKRRPAARLIIKLMWENGIICYSNQSGHWAKEHRCFELTRARFPSLDLRAVDEDSAVLELVRLYLRAYGPASVEDIRWWSGVRRSKILKALTELESEIATNEIDGLVGTQIELCESTRSFERRPPRATDPWVSFLAYEDPLLKAYHPVGRSRFVAPENYDLLFNAIGEARASVMVNGEVVGIWQWNRRICQVEWFGFLGHKQFSKGVRQAIDREAKSLEAFLRVDCGLRPSTFGEGSA